MVTEDCVDEWCPMVEQLRLRPVGPLPSVVVGRPWRAARDRRSGLCTAVEPADDRRPASTCTHFMLLLRPQVSVRGATTFSKLGVQFLGIGYCT